MSSWPMWIDESESQYTFKEAGHPTVWLGSTAGRRFVPEVDMRDGDYLRVNSDGRYFLIRNGEVVQRGNVEAAQPVKPSDT